MNIGKTYSEIVLSLEEIGYVLTYENYGLINMEKDNLLFVINTYPPISSMIRNLKVKIYMNDFIPSCEDILFLGETILSLDKYMENINNDEWIEVYINDYARINPIKNEFLLTDNTNKYKLIKLTLFLERQERNITVDWAEFSQRPNPPT